MDKLSIRSSKAKTLKKVGDDNKIKGISKIGITRASFKLMRGGYEFEKYLKGLPKLQRSEYDYLYARKIFKNGNIESNKVMSNKMSTQYYGALNLQEESDEQDWTRECYEGI